MSMNGVSWWLEAMAAISGRRAITSTRRVAADRGGWLPQGRPYGAGHWGTAATPAAWPLADGTPGPPHPAETTAGRRVTAAAGRGPRDCQADSKGSLARTGRHEERGVRSQRRQIAITVRYRK